MHDIDDTYLMRHARRLAGHVYEETAGFPPSERYLLVNQMRRAATSIGANLKEGSGRNTIREFRYFAGVAGGSACELEWHVVISGDLRFLPPANRDALLAEVIDMKKLIYRFSQSLARKEAADTPGQRARRKGDPASTDYGLRTTQPLAERTPNDPALQTDPATS